MGCGEGWLAAARTLGWDIQERTGMRRRWKGRGVQGRLDDCQVYDSTSEMYDNEGGRVVCSSLCTVAD